MKQSINYEAEDRSFNFHHTRDECPHPQDFPLHYENGYEIYLFISGCGEYNIEGNRYKLEPYSILMMNINEIHMLNISEEQPYERAVLTISKDFLPPFITHGVDFFRAIKFRKLGYGNSISSEIVASSGLLELFNKFEHHCRINDAENEIVAKCIIVQILSIINSISKTDLLPTHISGNDKINAVLEYINSNLNEQLSLDSICEKFYLTKYHLCHTFKQATGYSVNKYITFKRILIADGLMLEGYNATQSCFMSGFNDYSNFYKSYRKLTGRPPRSAKGKSS